MLSVSECGPCRKSARPRRLCKRANPPIAPLPRWLLLSAAASALLPRRRLRAQQRGRALPQLILPVRTNEARALLRTVLVAKLPQPGTSHGTDQNYEVPTFTVPLKYLLEKDEELVARRNKLVKVPARHPVNMIIDEVSYRTAFVCASFY